MSTSLLSAKIASWMRQGILARSMVASAGTKKPSPPRAPRVKGEVLPGVNISQLLAKPARPPSGYQLFIRDRFSALKKQNPGESLHQPLKSIASEWKLLAPTEKAKFVTAAKNEKSQASDYQHFRDIVSKKVTLSTVLKSIREAGIIKKPRGMSAYNVFVRENFKLTANGPVAARFQAVSNKWRQLSEAEKQEWNRRAARLNAEAK